MNLRLWRFNYAKNHKQQKLFKLYLHTTYCINSNILVWWWSWIYIVVMRSLQSVYTYTGTLFSYHKHRWTINQTKLVISMRCENDAGWQCTYWSRARWKRGKHNKSQFTHHQIHHQYVFSAKIDFVFIAEHSATYVLYYTISSYAHSNQLPHPHTGRICTHSYASFNRIYSQTLHIQSKFSNTHIAMVNCKYVYLFFAKNNCNWKIFKLRSICFQ